MQILRFGVVHGIQARPSVEIAATFLTMPSSSSASSLKIWCIARACRLVAGGLSRPLEVLLLALPPSSMAVSTSEATGPAASPTTTFSMALWPASSDQGKINLGACRWFAAHIQIVFCHVRYTRNNLQTIALSDKSVPWKRMAHHRHSMCSSEKQ